MGFVLTIRFLEPCTSTTTTELLWLAAPRISDKQGTIVANEDVLNLLLGLLIDVLLIEGNEGFGNTLADCVNLGGVTTTFHADAHVNAGETVATEKEDGLHRLVAEDLGLHQLDWAAVDLDEASAALAVGDGHGGLLPPKALD